MCEFVCVCCEYLWVCLLIVCSVRHSLLGAHGLHRVLFVGVGTVFAENKFAVGSGARVVSVCYFEEENDW